MATILLLHGFKSTGDSYFLPSLKQRYKKHTMTAPNFPNPENPDIDAWTEELKKVKATNVDVVIAHSLGVCLALSALSRDILSTKALVMISGSPGPKDHPAMDTFLRYPFQMTKIQQNVPDRLVVQSMDDPWTIPEYGPILMKHLNCPGLLFEDQGHFEQPLLPESLQTSIDAFIAKYSS